MVQVEEDGQIIPYVERLLERNGRVAIDVETRACNVAGSSDGFVHVPLKQEYIYDL